MKKLFRAAAPALALLLLLSACGSGAGETPGEPAEPTPTVSRNAGIASLTLPASSVDELSQVADYPDLKELDLSGSSLPTETVAAWAAAHPDIHVKYSVLVGDLRVSPDAESFTAPAGIGYEELTAALAYLPDVKSFTLPDTALDLEQLQELGERYEVDYSVRLLGQTLDSRATELDLSTLDPADVPMAAGALRSMPALERIELMDEAGNSTLGPEEVKTVMAAAPNAAVHYTFELFGKTVSTTDERVEFVGQRIGNEGEAEIRAALDLLPAGTYFKLDGCGVSDEVMASIRDDYPDKKVVWRIYCTYWFNALTDDEVILMTFDLNDENCGPLKYCTEARYIDVGHNNTLHDISWVQYMPKLECIIISGAPVSDLSGFANCPNLTWLELAFCYYVTDLTPLSELKNLKYLNTSCSQLQDISPLKSVPLERFMCAQYPGQEIPEEQQKAFLASHPDCLAIFEAFDSETLKNNPYGYGWRYDDEGYSYFSYYARMRQVFHYPDPGWYGGWKMSDVDPE